MMPAFPIAAQLQEACAEAALSPADLKFSAGRQFFNSYVIEGLGRHRALQDAFRAARDILIASGDA
jgi:serine/threonine-protein kinase HipA